MSALSRLPIILDCDPGHDDAIAIVVAAAHADLLGITTVAGNAPLELTTRNALIMSFHHKAFGVEWAPTWDSPVQQTKDSSSWSQAKGCESASLSEKVYTRSMRQ